MLPDGDFWKLGFLILLMIITSLLELVGVGLIPVFVAILADPDRLLERPELLWLWEWTGVDDFESLFFFGTGALVVIFLFKNIYITFYHYVEGRYIWKRYEYISGKLFRSYMNAPYTFHLNRNSSIILRHVTEEGRYLANQVLGPMLKLLMNFIIMGGLLLLLLWVEPVISLIVFVVIGGVGGLFIWLLRNRMSGIGERANMARSEMIKFVNEGLEGIKEIRVLKRESWFVGRFVSKLRDFVHSQTFFTVVVHSNKPVTETVAVVGMLVIAVYLYLQGHSVESMITTMALFGAATVRMLPSMREIMRDINNLRYYSYSVTPIYEDVLSLNAGGEKVSRGLEFDRTESRIVETSLRFEREIRFENVSFTYPEARVKTVRDLTFTIRKGEVAGLAGATGAGKTTIVDLMLGLLKPQQGTITFDGINWTRYLSEHPHGIGYIPQSIFLIDDTLEHNIAFGLPDSSIDFNRIEECVRLAQLSGFVEGLPDGIHTVVGERGVRLSGGQRQRIGIARGLYHDPEILIMDEATSALDHRTEDEILSAIEQYREERTIIIITHRLSTLKLCNTIWFLENGRITDSGTLDSLTRNNPEFRKMGMRD